MARDEIRGYLIYCIPCYPHKVYIYRLKRLLDYQTVVSYFLSSELQAVDAGRFVGERRSSGENIQVSSTISQRASCPWP